MPANLAPATSPTRPARDVDLGKRHLPQKLLLPQDSPALRAAAFRRPTSFYSPLARTSVSHAIEGPGMGIRVRQQCRFGH